MKRLVLFAAVVALAACAKKDEAPAADSSTAMAAPAPMTVADSAAKADSMKADSVRKDSIAKADTTKH